MLTISGLVLYKNLLVSETDSVVLLGVCGGGSDNYCVLFLGKGLG